MTRGGARALLAWVLVGVGSAALAYPAVAYAGGALRQTRLSAEVRTLLGPPESVRRDAGLARPVATRPFPGQALGIVRIPSIGVDHVFLEGVTDGVLLTGPGHVPGTALPGSVGVSVLAAHRDMHFRDLKDVRVGDAAFIALQGRRLDYRVVSRRIAEPDERWVTASRGRAVLRLVTCWPPSWIGPAPQRLVVSAVPVRPEHPPARWPRAARRARPRAPASTLGPDAVVASGVNGPFGGDVLPPMGAAGATGAALAAFGACRSRRRLAWWFLPWLGGLGVAALSLVAAWAGPTILLA